MSALGLKIQSADAKKRVKYYNYYPNSRYLTWL